MSTPPSWSAPDPERPNPFAPPEPVDGETPGWAQAPMSTPVPPSGYTGASPSMPAPYASDRSGDPTPHGQAPAAPTPPVAPVGYYSAVSDGGPSDAPATDPSPYGAAPAPGYGYPPAAPAYGSPQAPGAYGPPQPAPAYGAPQAPPTYGYPPAPPAYGYPQGAPAYGSPQAPPPGYAYSSPQGPPLRYGSPSQPVWAPAQVPIDGLSIASLATSAAGLFTVGATGVVGLGLGIASLRRIRRSGDRGRGMAIAGVVTGALMTLFFVAYVGLISWGLSGGFDESSSADAWSDTDLPSTGGSDELGSTLPSFWLAAGLLPGSCFEESPYEYDLSDRIDIDCAEPHTSELFATVELTSSPTPYTDGADLAVELAWDECSAQLDTLATDYPELDVWVEIFYPHPDQWAAGETTGYCLLGAAGADIVGSVVGHTITTTSGTLS